MSEVVGKLKAENIQLRNTLARCQWSTGYDQCPLCHRANPAKMEAYRANFDGKPEDFRENDFGHSSVARGDAWDCPIGKLLNGGVAE